MGQNIKKLNLGGIVMQSSALMAHIIKYHSVCIMGVTLLLSRTKACINFIFYGDSRC